MDKFVDRYYLVEKFQAAYEGIVPNIIDKNQWPEVDKGFHLHPPVGQNRGPDRQKKLRTKPVAEGSGKATSVDMLNVKDVVNMVIGKVARSVNLQELRRGTTLTLFLHVCSHEYHPNFVFP